MFEIVVTCSIPISAQCYKEVDCGYSIISIPCDWMSYWESGIQEPNKDGITIERKHYSSSSHDKLDVYDVRFWETDIKVYAIPDCLKKLKIIDTSAIAKYSNENKEWQFSNSLNSQDSVLVRTFARYNGFSVKAISIRFLSTHDSIVDPIYKSWKNEYTGRRDWPDIDDMPGALYFY